MARAGGTPQKVSVIMPVRNGAEVIGEQLRALSRQDYREGFEVVVADNGSTDGTAAVVQSFADRLPGLRLVDASERSGPTHARNRGAAEARGDFLAYCDADDVVAPGWLRALAAAGGAHHVVGGRIDHETLNDPKTRAWRGQGGHPGLPVLLGFLPYALGANMGVWAEVLAELGGWNEDFGTGGDDVELCWRAHLRGYPLGFAADAVVSYRHRPDLRGLARQMYRYGLAEPHIYRLYLGAGVPRQTLREGVSRWVHLGLGVVDLLRAEPRRGLWVRQAAFRLGRLHGSVRQRVWCV